VLDNLSALSHGELPPHQWPVAKSDEIERLEGERDEARKTRDAAQAQSTKDLEAKRIAEAALAEMKEENVRLRERDFESNEAITDLRRNLDAARAKKVADAS
jgi:uncharacterized small protein (DUF1192 family)